MTRMVEFHLVFLAEVIIIIIIHSFLYRHKVVTSEGVAEQVRNG